MKKNENVEAVRERERERELYSKEIEILVQGKNAFIHSEKRADYCRNYKRVCSFCVQ